MSDIDDVIVVTTNDLPGYEVVQVLGEVFGLIVRARKVFSNTPVAMLLVCPDPRCGARHIDEGEFATKPHHTHACQHCGMVWRPSLGPTVGVQFLPGFKNEET